MNIFLKNKVLNVVISFLVCTMIFVAGFILFGLVAQIVLAAIALYVAGALSYWVMQWFDEKYIQLNEGE